MLNQSLITSNMVYEVGPIVSIDCIAFGLSLVVIITM